MKELLDKYLMKMLDGLKEGKDFLVEQLPPIAEQYLTYKLIECIIAVVISSIFTFFIGRIVSKRIEIAKKDYVDEIDAAIIIFGSVGCLTAFGVAVSNLLESIKIYVAPKIYLIEYLKELVK